MLLDTNGATRFLGLHLLIMLLCQHQWHTYLTYILLAFVVGPEFNQLLWLLRLGHEQQFARALANCT